MSYIIVVAECSRHTLLLFELKVVCLYVNQLFDGGLLAETVPLLCMNKAMQMLRNSAQMLQTKQPY